MAGDNSKGPYVRRFINCIANLPLLTQPSYRKPSKLGWVLMLAGAAVFTIIPTYFISTYSATQRFDAGHQRHLEVVNGIESKHKKEYAALKEELDKANESLDDKKSKISELERTVRSFTLSEPERLRSLREELSAYKNTHPEDITKEAFDILQSRFDSAERRAKRAESDLQDYKLVHPEDVTPQLVERLRAELAMLKSDLDSYKKDHPYSRSEQEGLARKCSALEEKLKAQVRQDNAGIPIDWKGRIIGYHDSFDEGHLYFCIPCSVGKSESDLKILGDKIPESVAKKYNFASRVASWNDSWDYDYARVVFKIVDEGKYEYRVQLIKGNTVVTDLISLSKEDLLKCMKVIIEDNER